MDFLLIFCVLAFGCISFTDAHTSSNCSEFEQAELNVNFTQCSKQLTEQLLKELSNPGNVMKTNQTNKEVSVQCKILHEILEKCGPIFKICLDENQYR